MLAEADAEKRNVDSRLGIPQIASNVEKLNTDTEKTGSARKFEGSADTGLAAGAPHGQSSGSHQKSTGHMSPPERRIPTAPSA